MTPLKGISPIRVVSTPLLNTARHRVLVVVRFVTLTSLQRRGLHSEITIKGIQEGRKNVQAAVGATSHIAGPFSKTQSFLRYGGNDLIDEALRLRNKRFEEEEATMGDGIDTTSMSGYSVATPGTAGLMLPPVSPHSAATMSPALRSRGLSRRGR